MTADPAFGSLRHRREPIAPRSSPRETLAVHHLLRETRHRTDRPPARRWVMTQTWCDLLFAHYRVEPAALRPCVPEALELDLFDGRAYVGVVPFRMEGIRLRGLPRVPGTHAFAEMNVRTYVRSAGVPGVWFFSLDATNPLAVAVARCWFHLPYHRAAIECRPDGDWTFYWSRRAVANVSVPEFRGRYRPAGPVALAEPGSLEHFLTERYRLFAEDRRGCILSGEIHHLPWPLQPAEAEIRVNTMTATLGLPTLPEPPLLHFARRIETLEWAPRRLPPRG